MASQLQGMFQNLNGGKTKKRKLKIKEALKELAFTRHIRTTCFTFTHHFVDLI